MTSRRNTTEEEPPPAGLVVYAADDIAVLSLPSTPAQALASLTRAELAVAGLLVDGLSNAGIAAARGRSERTVANQVASIFGKLGVGSRAELARRHVFPSERSWSDDHGIDCSRY